MPTVNIRGVLAANGTLQPLAGTLFEFLDEPSTVEIGLKTDATGVLATINTGPTQELQEGPISVGTINLMPVYPDDFFQAEGDQGDRLLINLRDTSGAQRIVMVQLRIHPL